MKRRTTHIIPLLRVVAAAILAIMPAREGVMAYDFLWDVDFGSVFDNREGDDNIMPAKTIIFTQLSPEIGIGFNGGRDALKGGVVWTQPIGCEWDGAKVAPTLYYQHTGPRWRFAMGMLPRHLMREELPDFLWSDSLTYYQRNIRGVLVGYDSPDGFLEAYLDWRGLQSKTRREAFNIVFHGQYAPQGKTFLAGGHVMMNHYALTEDAPDDQHIVDNFMIHPYAGINITGSTPLDSISARAGPLLTIERNRAHDHWRTPLGAWLEVKARWKWLGVSNTLYAGGAQMPSFREFGSQLYQGEPYYQCSFYDRVRVFADIIRNNTVDLRAELDFNFTGNTFIFYQKITLGVNLGGKVRPGR